MSQDQSKKRKEQGDGAPWLGSAEKIPKRSSAELLELANDAEKYSSEEEQMMDSDMDQRDYSEEDKSKKSNSAEEADTIDITPLHSKAFSPSKDQRMVWE